MSYRVSQIIVQSVLLDEYDAPQPTDPITFVGDELGSAVEHVERWLSELPDRLQNVQPPKEA